MSVRTADRPPRLVLRFALYSAIALLFASLAILWFVRYEAQQSAEREVGDRARLIAAGLSHHLAESDFARPVDAERRKELDEVFQSQLVGGIVRVKLWSRIGVLTYSDTHSIIATQSEHPDDLARALRGETVREDALLSDEGGVGPDLRVLEAYVPLYVDGSRRPVGVLEVYQDYGPVAADTRAVLMPVAMALGLALLGLWMMLLPILRQVTRTLEARTRRLAEQANELQRTLAERERVETSLRETEAGYQSLLERLPLAVYIRGLDMHSPNIYVSPQVEPMLGYPAEQWRQDPDLASRVIHPDDRERAVAEGAEVRRTGKPMRSEYRIIASDGRVVWVEDVMFLVRDEDGKPLQVQGFLLDITERKQAEQAVLESEQKFRTLVANVPGVVFRCEIDADWTMHFMSDEIEELSGYLPTDFVDGTRTFASIIHPDDVESLAGAVDAAVSEDRVYTTEYRIITRSGAVRWVLERGQAVTAPDGHCVLDGAILDLTESKAAAEEAAKLAAIVESSDDAIMGALLDGTITSWNKGAERMFGYTADEVLGKSATVVASPDHVDEPPALIARATAGESITHYETVRKRKDGTLFDVSITVSPVRDVSGHVVGVSAIAQDITERKRAEAERERLLTLEREQNERLRELDRLKDEFVALVSHELRTPLTSIRGYLELVLDGEAGEVTDEQRQFLSVVERNADRLLTLVGDLLFLAQIEAGKLVLEVGAVDVVALASDSVEGARPLAEDKDITLTLATGPMPLLAADGARIAQLLDNLVSNALKFTPEGGRVDVRAHARNGSAILEVRDSGIGIPTDEQERLFERFFRSSNAAERQIPGTGLGLAISKAIVEAHGGAITVASETDAGTTFRVSLPIHRQQRVARERETVAL